MPLPVFSHRMIEVFRAVILHQGISAAAEALGTSQSSVSRDVAELQKLVGYPLLVKHGRTVRPTEQALALMAKVQQSFLGLEDIARFSEHLRKARMGRLALCAIPAIAHSVMPDAIRFLRQTYPNVLVTLDIASSADVVRRVRSRQADLGFASHGLTTGEVETVAQLTGHWVCIGAPGDFAPEQVSVDARMLAGRPFIALTGPLQTRLEVMLAEVGASVDTVAEVSHSYSASELVLRGLGISVVDPYTGELHRLKGGTTLPLQPGLPWRAQALAMGDARLGEPARALLAYLAPAVGKAGAGAASE